MMRIVVVMGICLLVLLAGCESGREFDGVQDEAVADASVIAGTGTINYVPLEGGFYEIQADTGERYVPIDLPEGYEEDGLEVSFVLRAREDMAGIWMRGQIVEILQMEPIFSEQ